MPEGAPKSELISADASSATPCPQRSVRHLLRRAGDEPISASTPGTPHPPATEAADEWGGTPMMRPNPRPPPPKRQLPRGSSEREPGCRSTAKPGDRSHTRRWRPGARCAETRTTAKPTIAPPKRAARDPDAQPPLQAAAPATQPTATKVDDLRGDHRMSPRRSHHPRVARARVEGAEARIIGRSAPRTPEGDATTAQPTGDDRGEPRTPNRRPATTARSTRR